MTGARSTVKPSWRRRLYRELQSDVDDLLARGWVITTGANGFKMFNSLGKFAFTIHFTPSDRRAIRNYRALIKRKLQEEADELRRAQETV